ncbi:MAG TPA: hypothetical protein VGD29_07365 [Actinoplanes sp.]|jgi:hypothetical protein
MSAPGNSILIIALIALFVACCGYAAGRIHQRRQTGDDREAAYRDGYEKGSHSVFSLAARVIVRRRPVQAAAAVKPASEARDETTLLPQLSPSASPSSPLSGPPAPRLSAQPTPPPLSAQPAPQPSAQPSVMMGAAAGSFPGAGMSQMGFPVPPPPPAGTVPEPSAVGGVRFQRFPDPRTGGETTVLPDMSERVARPAGSAEPSDGESVPAPRRAPGHRAPEDEQDTISPAPSSEEAPGAVPSGRHTVPEELVKAATYRLPPDRVFRAKVRDTTDEPTTKLVPKPRQS